MKTIVKAIVPLLFTILILFAFSSCTLTVYFGLSGQVLDVKDSSGSGISGVELTLKDSTGSIVAITTSGPDGSFQFQEVETGQYTIEGEGSEYAVLNQDIDIINSGLQSVRVYAFAPGSGYSVTLITVWNDAVNNINANITYPDADKVLSGGDPPCFYLGYRAGSAAGDGFEPTIGAVGRKTINETNNVSTITHDDVYSSGNTLPLVELDTSASSGLGPETITIRGIPFQFDTSLAYYQENTNGYEVGLPGYSTTIAWLGVMKYYLTTPVSTEYLATADGSGADARVYIVENSAAGGTSILGIFDLPENIQLDSAAVIEINMFLDEDTAQTELVFTPNIEYMDEYSPKTTFSNGPVVSSSSF